MSMNNPKQRLLLPGNPSGGSSSCIKSRFTRGFLRALIKMKKQNYNQPTSSSSSSSSRREVFRRRYRRVKIAADKSMAVAVGSTRLWSRAMLSRIRHQYQQQRWRYHRSNFNHQPIKVKRLVIEKKKKEKLRIKQKEEGSDDHHRRGLRDAGELRKLVPGGEGMDICSLLDETAHYIKCLVTQVQVMKSIDQFYSIN
ncbi:hypothetical protein Dsin_031976 [Dipteronia sinensis]|uniref:IBH1-like N-terminal domain-containing protein n=1 Tax=Dipteronia sinensis TaxID=43782 RepID=A0AAD9ZMK9_9ROSI|nr:hypothetical protein Dsin_031976 [Dipteronia sinensis]